MKKFIKYFFVEMDEVNVYLLLSLFLATVTTLSIIIAIWTN